MADQWEEAAKEFKGSRTASQPATTTAAPDDDWKIWNAKSEPERPGFLPSLWESVKHGPANLAEMGNSINSAFFHPLQALRSYGAQNEELRHGAADAFGRGDIAGGLRRGAHWVLNGIPGLGASMEDASQEFDRGNTAAGFGKTVGLGINTAIGIETPKIMRGAATGIDNAINNPNALKGPFRADPRVAINRALRPVPSDPGFPQRIPQTIGSIKEANPGFKPDVKDGNFNLIPATQKAIDLHQQALDPWMNRAAGVEISGDPIVNATRTATNGMLPSEGASAQSLIDRSMQDYGGKFSPDQLRERLTLLNQRLKSFYDKAPGKQSAALADIPEAVLKAQRDAVADTLYRSLDPEGAGAGPRTIQSRTGDLIDFKDAALRRQNAIVAEQPLTPFGRIVDPMKAMVRSLMPGKATGAGIAFAEGSEGRSLPFVRKAFNAVNDTPSVLPRPETPFYPTGDPRRLLTTGDMITPPPADTSYVRGAGIAPHQQVNLEPRLLNPSRAPFGVNGVIVPEPMPRTGPTTHRFLNAPESPIGGPHEVGVPRVGQPLPNIEMPDTSGIKVTDAARDVTRDPKTGRMKRYYTSAPKEGGSAK